MDEAKSTHTAEERLAERLFKALVPNKAGVDIASLARVLIVPRMGPVLDAVEELCCRIEDHVLREEMREVSVGGRLDEWTPEAERS